LVSDSHETAEARWVSLLDAEATIASGEIAGAMTVIDVQNALLRRAAARYKVADNRDGSTLLSGQASPRALRISSTAPAVGDLVLFLAGHLCVGALTGVAVGDEDGSQPDPEVPRGSVASEPLTFPWKTLRRR
jgi:hypothetical protein